MIGSSVKPKIDYVRERERESPQLDDFVDKQLASLKRPV